MAAQNKEIRKWLEALPDDKLIGIDERGLTLVVVGNKNTYFEIGGVPEDEGACLEGWRCPKCGHTDSFRVSVRSMAIVHDDGVETYGNMEWDEDAYVECNACSFSGQLNEDFKRGDDDDQPNR